MEYCYSHITFSTAPPHQVYHTLTYNYSALYWTYP